VGANDSLKLVVKMKLPSPLSCKEIVDGVFLVDTMAVGLPGLAAAYLIKGEELALVDTGYPTSSNSIISQLQALDSRSWQVDFIVPTHVHLDHSGAVGHLLKAMPNARVLVNERGAKHLVDPTKLVQSVASLFGSDALAVFGEPVSVLKERIDTVRDGCELDLGAGKRLKIFSTPGHALHHMSVLLEAERLVITGDAVGIYYPNLCTPIPATPPPSFDEEQYMRSLTRMLDMNPVGLLLPHFGPVLENVEAFLRTNLQTTKRWGSRVFEAVKANESHDEVYQYFVQDLLKLTGKSQDDIPDYMSRMILISAIGYYSYAQKRLGNESRQ